MLIRNLTLKIAAVMAVAVTGCSSSLPWGRSDDGASAGSSAGSFGDSGQLGVPSVSYGTPAGPPRSTAANSLYTDAKSMASRVADAFEIKQKVHEAPDPSSLAYMPEHLNPLIYVEAARWSEQQGHVATAQAQYEKALALDPRHIGTLVAYARLCDRQDQSQQALELYHRALSVDPNHAMVLNDLGLCQARRGDLEASAQSLKRAVAAEPANPRYRNNLARVQVAGGQPEAAVQSFQGVYPEATAYYNVGYFLYMQDEQAASVEYFQRALRSDPTLKPAQEMLARLDAPVGTVAQAYPPAATRGSWTGQAGLSDATTERSAARTSNWAPASPAANTPSYASHDQLRKLPAIE